MSPLKAILGKGDEPTTFEFVPHPTYCDRHTETQLTVAMCGDNLMVEPCAECLRDAAVGGRRDARNNPTHGFAFEIPL